ncbi:MAG: right-handed parallel beta-helix repeat-containing protein, partial [Ignavibacteriaceae bacterium]|nr:right-handed parallel beta-helix repeat-containing protein [Ignavibacteriaceae bacterium]
TITEPTTDFATIIFRNKCSIEGFSIIVREYYSGGGTGIYALTASNPIYGEIKNNKFSIAGAGIIASDSYLTIKNNVFETVTWGIDVTGSTTSMIDSIYNNFFNVRDKGIGTNLGARAVIFNNTIMVNDEYGDAISMASTGTSKIYNNLLIGRSDLSDHGFIAGYIPFEIKNNIAFGFKVGFSVDPLWLTRNNISLKNIRGYKSDQPPPDVKYNNAWDNGTNYSGFTPDSTNLSVNPMFVNEDSLNFYLQMYSRLIDAGDPSILDKDSTRSDIGLYGGPYGESYKYLDIAPRTPKGITASIDSNYITISWLPNTESDFHHYRLFRDTLTGFIADSLSLAAELRTTIYTHLIPKVDRLYYKLTAVDNQKNESNLSEEIGVILVSAKDKNPFVVHDYILYQNYPNPYNPSTQIAFRLKELGYVKLSVYDIKGELVEVLVNGYKESGFHEVSFIPKSRPNTPSDIASGIYIYKIEVLNSKSIPVFNDIKKMIYLK